MPKKRYTFHVISNTHWDREWRFPFQETRSHLVELMDELLDLLDRMPEYKHYHLDSQTIPLEDYLEIRPENRERLRKHVSDGRILVGPWYTLPEMNTVSGEAIVRNLMRGHRIASEFGRVMKVGYTPTSYGQISQIAQIYSNFGIDGMMFYRGIVREECGTEYILEAPDGSRILGLRLSALFSRASFWLHLFRPTIHPDKQFDGYYRWGMGLCPFRRCDADSGDPEYRLLEPRSTDVFNAESLDKGMESLRADLSTDALSSHLIAMDGMDSVFPHPNTIRTIDACNNRNTGDVYVHSSFPEAIEKIRASVPLSKLKVLKGERRHQSVDNWFNRMLKDNISTRLYQKQNNARMQTLLEKWAEPYATAAWWHGMEYPSVYLDLAWKYLLSNHPHDSITGVSVDAVHDDMVTRWRQVKQIGETVVDRSFGHLAKQIDRSDIPDEEILVVVFNPLQWGRTEVVEAWIDFPDLPKRKSLQILDAETRKPVPFQLIERKDWGSNVMNRYDIPAPFLTRRFKVLLDARDIPACGFRTFRVKSTEGELANHGSLRTSSTSMENETLSVHFHPNGTFDLGSKADGRVFSGCHVFEDDADAGDPWTRIVPLENHTVSSLGCSSTLEWIRDGELECIAKVSMVFTVPRGLDSGKHKRTDTTVPLDITSWLTLRKGSPRLDIETRIENRAMDHRLRVRFPSGIASDTVHAEVPFDVVERTIRVRDARDWVEPCTGTQPHLSFVDLSDGKSGLALISHGLVEYEVMDDPARTMVLTLLKGIRYPKVGLPPERVERLDQIGSQCLGSQTTSYALYPHTGNWKTGKVFEATNRFNIPLRLVQVGPTSGHLPKTFQWLSLQPDDCVLSAVKKTEGRDTTIVRIFNPTDLLVHTKVKCARKIRKAWSVNLNEERGDVLPVAQDGILGLAVGRKKITSVELQF